MMETPPLPFVTLNTDGIGKLHNYVRVNELGDSPNNKPELW